MSPGFDVKEGGLKRGVTGADEKRRDSTSHRLQERFPFDVLDGSELRLRNLLRPAGAT